MTIIKIIFTFFKSQRKNKILLDHHRDQHQKIKIGNYVCEKMVEQVVIFVGQPNLGRNVRQLIPSLIVSWIDQFYLYYYQKSTKKIECLNTT